MQERVFRLGELFSGPGGIGIAASKSEVITDDYRLSLKHVWANDYDKDSCETYQRNLMPDDPDSVICKDIRQLDLNKLKEISDIDALAFGFPCNDFSVVGEQKGMNGAYGPLYTYGVNCLQLFQPKWFLAENVGGLRNSNDGKALKKVLNDLAEAGYKVYPHFYKFEEYGVPQARHRVIIIGIRDDLDYTFEVPKPTFETITSKEAIENPPIPEHVSNQVLTNQSKTVIERLKHIKPGENAFNADLPDHLKLNVKGAKISQIYKRLDPEKPSYTVTGSGGGGTHVYHWEENRALTNRERARLQTFPDDHVFYGSKESIRKQIGMAVPVKGAKVIIESVLKTFAGIEYESIQPNIEMPQPRLINAD